MRFYYRIFLPFDNYFRLGLIYRWRGSLNAMKEIEGSKLFLTQSFRFGGAVAEAGNRILKRLGENNLIKPNPIINSKIGQIDE
eukprot:UN34061